MSSGLFNPYAPNTSMPEINGNERGKKRQYNQRIVEVEHGSFTPVVFSAYGGCGERDSSFPVTFGREDCLKEEFGTLYSDELAKDYMDYIDLVMQSQIP